MKRYRAIRDFLSCLEQNDVAVFSGESISKEAYLYDKKGYFYTTDSYGMAPSLALGIAMSTDKRTFIFDGDGSCMMELSSLAQIAASKTNNIFYVILDNGCYQAAGGQPTIFREMSSVKGFIFSLGFTVFELTNYFKSKSSVLKMQKIVRNLRGPAAIIIKVDKGVNNKIGDLDIDKIELRDRITEFIKDMNLGTSLFIPPALGDLSMLMNGGKV